MPELPGSHLLHMRDSAFFDGPEQGRKLSRYWLLLTLSSIIAAAGVAADSIAVVIGAMIVAPLMVPILGTVLAIILGDRTNLVRSVVLVTSGALLVVGTALGIGLMLPFDVTAATSSQVDARIHPGLLDLLAALATGVVGSVALARRDVANTLPGVAISISLVLPLSVIGFTLAAGATAQAWGAFLLFSTNVAAILTSGSIVMAFYRVYRQADLAGDVPTVRRGGAAVAIASVLIVIAVALTHSSLTIWQSLTQVQSVRAVAEVWEEELEWELVDAWFQEGRVVLLLEGPPPMPPTDGLVELLHEQGMDPADVLVEFIPRITVDLGAAETPAVETPAAEARGEGGP